MNNASSQQLELALIGEVAAARRRLNVIEREWVKPATTPEQLANARQALYISWQYLRRLQQTTIELDAALACRRDGVQFCL